MKNRFKLLVTATLLIGASTSMANNEIDDMYCGVKVMDPSQVIEHPASGERPSNAHELRPWYEDAGWGVRVCDDGCTMVAWYPKNKISNPDMKSAVIFCR